MVTEVNWVYWDDHSAIYTKTESLRCTPETSIICLLSIFNNCLKYVIFSAIFPELRWQDRPGLPGNQGFPRTQDVKGWSHSSPRPAGWLVILPDGTVWKTKVPLSISGLPSTYTQLGRRWGVLFVTILYISPKKKCPKEGENTPTC